MKKMNMITAVLAAILAITMTGCGMNQNAGTTVENIAVTNSNSVSTEESEESTETAAVNQEGNGTVDVVELSQKTESAEQNSELFTKRDLAQTADLSDAQRMTVNDGQTIDITDEGVYVISGSAKNCTIRVSADEAAKIQLVLDGVSITNDDFPAIYVISADKVFITTTDSDNTLTISGQFRADGDTNTDAVIFSKDDLVLNGTGTLKIVSASGNGVSSKDTLKITGGTYVMQAGHHAFEANDLLAVSGGSFTIDTEKDGFHCEKDTEGNIYIADGTFTISEALRNKFKNIYVKVSDFWLQYFFRQVMENNLLQRAQLPVIDEDEAEDDEDEDVSDLDDGEVEPEEEKEEDADEHDPAEALDDLDVDEILPDDPGAGHTLRRRRLCLCGAP